MSAPEPAGQAAWDQHWENLRGPRTLFGGIATFVRRQLLSRAVSRYSDRFFSKRGVFVEAGCGTAQSSARLGNHRRRLVALDFSQLALREARRVAAFSSFLQADIRRLPFRDGTIAGIWNLGVMEHFDPPEGQRILGEFRRVLKAGGAVILFWPPEHGASRLVLAPLERFLSWRRGTPFSFFPDEVNRLRSRAEARRILREGGFETEAVDFTLRDLFIHFVLVGRTPAP